MRPNVPTGVTLSQIHVMLFPSVSWILRKNTAAENLDPFLEYFLNSLQDSPVILYKPYFPF